MNTIEELAERIRRIESVSGDLSTQMQRLQGGSGTVEPQSTFSAYDETTATPVSASAGNPTVSYVGQASQLLSGAGILFERIANSAYLRISTAGGLMNADYVVDAAGGGTHTTLFGASGALQAAIASGVSKTIWVCTTHTETVSAREAVTFVTNQTIVVFSGGGGSMGIAGRPTFTIGHANAVFRWTSDHTSQTLPHHLELRGLRFYRTTANAGHFSDFAASTSQMPHIVVDDTVFEGDSSNGCWGHFIDCRTTGAYMASLYWNHVTYVGLSASGSAHLSSVVATTSTSQFASQCNILNSDITATNIFFHGSGHTDVEAAQQMAVIGNRITLVKTATADTGYAWVAASTTGSGNARGFIFNNNTIIHKGNCTFIEAGFTNAAQDITITGNYYNANISGGGGATTFLNLLNTGGFTVNNVTCTANVLIGPGSGNAINTNGAAATMSQVGINAFRNWGTNVSGTGAMTTIAGPVTFPGAVTFSSALTVPAPLTVRGSDASTTHGMIQVDDTSTAWSNIIFTRSNTDKAAIGLWNQSGASPFSSNDFYMAVNDGSWHDTLALSTDGTKMKMVGAGFFGTYVRVGQGTPWTAPTNTTAGDLTAVRVKVGDGAFGTGVEFSVTGDGALSGFLRVGSETAPTNTTAGDLTSERLSVAQTGAFSTTGYFGRFGGTMTDTANGAAVAYAFTTAASPTSASLADFRFVTFSGIISPATGITTDTFEGFRTDLRHRSDAAVAAETGAQMGGIIVDSSSPASFGTLTLAKGLNVAAIGSLDTGKTGTVTTAIGLDIQPLSAGGASFTVTTLTGIRIQDSVSGATITDAIGIDIAALTRGGTTNVGIRNADRYQGTKYLSILGSATTPTNVTDGDLSAKRFMFSSTDVTIPTNAIGIISQPTVGNLIKRIQSVATNDDPVEDMYQNRLATTDATVSTLHTHTIPASTTVQLEAHVVARRTGGAAGTAEDGAGYIVIATIKNVAGTATLVGAVNQLVVQEDQAAWDCTIDVTGATARVRVTGAVNNNVTWHLSRLDVHYVSS